MPRAAINEDADMTGYRNTGYIRAVARLRPDVTEAQADAEVRSIGARLSNQYAEDGGRTAMLVGLREQLFGAIERPLQVLAGAVGFVLAIACANVASLLLGRGAARRRDLALRRAIGATRFRIVRQLLTEAAVLSVIGGAAGALVAWWGTASLLQIAPPELAAGGPRFDLRVLAFTLGVTLVSGLVFGLLPALQFSGGDLSAPLSEGSTRSSGTRRSGRIRDLLVVAEIAVALVLLVGSALLVRTFVSLTRVDTGIDTHNLVTFEVKLTGTRAEYQAQQVEFYAALQRRLEALPGVISAGSAVTLPIGGDDFGTSYLVEGRPEPRPGEEPHGGYQMVMPGFFRAMGIPIRRGRDFRESDTHASMPVAMVNDALAREQWPGQDPIGRRIRLDPDGPFLTIVGVVADIRHLGPASPPRPEVYQPSSQRSFSFMAFVVRTAGDPRAAIPAIRRAVAELDPALPLAKVTTMDEHLARALVAAQVSVDARDGVRAAGGYARRRRHLRRDVVVGRGTAARVRDPPRPRPTRRRCAARRLPQSRDPGDRRHRARPDRRARGDEHAAGIALRRPADRPAGVRADGGAARCRRACGVLCAGPPRDPRRPPDVAAIVFERCCARCRSQPSPRW